MWVQVILKQPINNSDQVIGDLTTLNTFAFLNETKFD